jgi:DNA ligase-1
MIRRPMKACDADLAKLTFPLLALPKIDGVRALVPHGQLRTRTMLPFANRKLQVALSRPEFSNLDGELTDASMPLTDQRLCRFTTSIVNTINDSRKLIFNVFDDFTIYTTYQNRYERAKHRAELEALSSDYIRVQIVPATPIYSRDEYFAFEAQCVADGYEGAIFRSPSGLYKEGRATVNENTYTRLKRFVDDEAVVLKIIEAQENLNEKQTNALGLSERSSHQENKIGKNMLGTLVCLWKGQEINVGPGEMTHVDRIFYFNNPEKLIGELITFKHFPHGQKDAPRQATFKHVRGLGV